MCDTGGAGWWSGKLAGSLHASRALSCTPRMTPCSAPQPSLTLQPPPAPVRTQVLRLPQALKQGLSRAAFDAAPLPGWEGARLAKGLRQALPWVRLVAPLREPIAAAIADLVAGPGAACLAE